MCLLVSILDLTNLLIDIVPYNGFDYFKPYLYMVVAVTFIAFGYICYRVGLEAAINYGVYIRTAFDLYRSRLLALFNLPFPENSIEELNLWSKLSEHLIVGNRLGLEPIFFEYKHQKAPKKKKSRKPRK